MKELAGEPEVGVEGESQDAVGASQTTGAVQQSVVERVQSLKDSYLREAVHADLHNQPTTALIAFGLGFLIGLRFLYYFFWVPAESGLHVQPLILAAVLMLAGFQMFLTGIVADLINSSRGVVEDVSYRLRRMELNQETKEPRR